MLRVSKGRERVVRIIIFGKRCIYVSVEELSAQGRPRNTLLWQDNILLRFCCVMVIILCQILLRSIFSRGKEEFWRPRSNATVPNEHTV